MPAIVSKKFRIHSSNQFVESFSETSPTTYYMFISKVSPFTNDLDPPAPVDTVFTIDFDYYRDMISMKRVNASDVTHAIPRYNWTSGNVYRIYDDKNVNLFPSEMNPSSNDTFYVMNQLRNVYKCIDNNRGAKSTEEPNGTSTSIITTSDGYRWKFMYRIPSADTLKFMTTNYIPVQTLSANNSSSQWEVQQFAANGAIHNIVISANGSGYLSTSGEIVAINTPTSFTINAVASGTDDVYNNSTIYLSAGTGVGQLRKIVDYIGPTRTVVVNSAFTVAPTSGTSYVIAPNVIIRGDSGSTVSSRASAYVSDCADGQVRKIVVITPGLNYSTANIEIAAAQGSGAQARAIISPPGGHGKDAVSELGGYNAMIDVKLYGTEANTFPSDNEFRVIGLLRDPLLRNGSIANSATIDQTTGVEVSSKSGNFVTGETITGDNSGVTSRFVYFSDLSATTGFCRVVSVNPTGTGLSYTSGEVIRGSTSGSFATVVSVVEPTVREFSGDILYTEHQSPITRSPNQIEDVKLLIRF